MIIKNIVIVLIGISFGSIFLKMYCHNKTIRLLYHLQHLEQKQSSLRADLALLRAKLYRLKGTEKLQKIAQANQLKPITVQQLAKELREADTAST